MIKKVISELSLVFSRQDFGERLDGESPKDAGLVVGSLKRPTYKKIWSPPELQKFHLFQHF